MPSQYNDYDDDGTVNQYKNNSSTPRQNNLWKHLLILTEESILCLFGLIFTLMAFCQTRRLKFSIATRQSHVEEFLLYTAFFFTANYTISTIILTADFVQDVQLQTVTGFNGCHILIVRCTLNAFELVQILFQTYMIQDSFHRCSDRIQHQIQKPGRQSIVALLGINLAFWIQRSFQFKNTDVYFLMENQKGHYGWILFVVSMPISLFYRYHCTVCLSQCFNKLYEDETQRFEEIWRYKVDPLTDMINPTVNAYYMLDAAYDTTSVPVILEVKSEDDELVNNVSQADTVAIANSNTLNNTDTMELNPRNRQLTLAQTKTWKTFDVTTEDIETDWSTHTRQQMGELEGSRMGSQQDITLHPICQNDKQLDKEPEPYGGPSELLPEVGITPATTECQHMSKGDFRSSLHAPVYQLSTFHPVYQTETLETGSVNTITCTSLSSRQNTLWLNDSKTHKSQNIKQLTKKQRRHSINVLLPLGRNSNLNEKNQSSDLKDNMRSTGPTRRMLQRRRTLRNLETAKKRVLAAELTHRMVIERGVGSPIISTPPNGSVNDTRASTNLPTVMLSLAPNSNSWQSYEHENSAVDRWSTHRGSSKLDYNILDAVTETAVVTIAPVESEVAQTLKVPGLKFGSGSKNVTLDTDTCLSRRNSGGSALMRAFRNHRPTTPILGTRKAENTIYDQLDRLTVQNVKGVCSGKRNSWSFRRTSGTASDRTLFDANERDT